MPQRPGSAPSRNPGGSLDLPGGLVLELHHPLPGPGDGTGASWASAAVDSNWPILRGLLRFAELQSGGSLTLAISPSWMALAADPLSQAAVADELTRCEKEGRARPGLHEFIVDRWNSDARALVHHLGASGAVESDSDHLEPHLAARRRLRAGDRPGPGQAGRRRSRPADGAEAVWNLAPLAGLLARPGMDSGRGRAQFFGVGGNEFLRGTTLPPDHLFAPMITPPGVAAFGVDPSPPSGFSITARVSASIRAITTPSEPPGPRPVTPRNSSRAGGSCLKRGISGPFGEADPISVAALSAHDLTQYWPGGKGAEWLDQVLMRLPTLEGACDLTRPFLDRQPTGIVAGQDQARGLHPGHSRNS